MEQSNLKIFWDKHYKQLLILFIRMTEVFMSSIIPSFIGVVLIFINPNQRIWDAISIFSMIGFAIINCRFLLKYVASRGSHKIEFYVINGIVYLTYAAASIIAYHTFGYLLYSMVFANLRVFEIFHLKTIQSIYVSNAVIILTMIVFRSIAYRHVDFIQRLMGIEEVEESELERYYSESEATQNNQNVNILSLEEMNDNIIDEIKEAHEAYLSKFNKTPDELWRKFERGDGSEIEFATPENIDDDYDDKDYVAANNVNLHEQYDADTLWEDIYKGQEKIDNYDDEFTPPPAPEKRNRFKEIADEISWHLKSLNKLLSIKHNYQRNELMLRDIRAKTARGVNVHTSYDSDTLWERSFYQGDDENAVPEKVMDFDETPEFVKRGLEFDAYDSDSLWDMDKTTQFLENDDAENEALGEQINLNEDYDAESLWGSELQQGRGEVIVPDADADELTAQEVQNLNEDYESDSLWSRDLKQGRGE